MHLHAFGAMPSGSRRGGREPYDCSVPADRNPADGRVDRSAVVTDLLRAILEADNVTRRLGEAVNKVTGIRRSNYVMLLHLYDDDGRRITALASALELDISVVSRRVVALEEAGLVSREVDPDDRRAQVVSLTRAGRDTIAHNRSVYVEALEDITSSWGTDELRTLASGLHRLGSHGLPDLDADVAP